MRSALAAFMLAVGISACAQHAAQPQTLRIAIARDLKTLNPLYASNSVEGFVWRLMFEPLIAADAHGKPFPMLAAEVPTTENGGISRDGLTITYRLRPNLKWTDGAPITSADVRFTWRAIVNPANSVPSRHGYDDVAAIDTPDARTAVVHLRHPFAPFVNTFFAESDQVYAILPAHVLERYRDLNDVPFNGAPRVSDGPFRFVRWDQGDRVVLSANDAFFLGKPNIANIDVISLPNEVTAGNELYTGSVQYFMQPSTIMYQQLSVMEDVTTVYTPVNGYESLAFNLRRTPMNDVRFRRALAYGIDKRQLVHDLTFDRAQVATADLPDWMWAHDPVLAPSPYDPGKARALLAAAHIRTPVRITLVTDSGDLTHMRLAAVLQSMLHAIGVELQIKTFAAALLYAPEGAHGVLTSGDFDLALFPWVGGIDPDNSSEFSCGSIPPNGWNVARYCNPAMDALQHTALTSYNVATRTAAYHEIEQLVMRDAPMIVLWWPRTADAIRNNFKGFAPSPTSSSWNAWQWSL